MRTKNNIRIQFVIEVRDTYSNCDPLSIWWTFMTLEDGPNPSVPASLLALNFAKKRAKNVLGTICDEDDPNDNRICIKSEWQIVKKTITEEVIDMDQTE